MAKVIYPYQGKHDLCQLFKNGPIISLLYGKQHQNKKQTTEGFCIPT